MKRIRLVPGVVVCAGLALSPASSGSQQPATKEPAARPPAAAGAVSVAALLKDTSRALPVDPAVRTGVLPNGMRYFIRKNARPKARAELRLVVNAGSVLEDDDQRGLAHFVEHMAFNGTRRFAKSEIVDVIERSGMRFGADLNAYTSFDETVYQLQIPTDSAHLVRTAFQILQDWAGGITFDSAEVEKERGVVIEEWRLGRGADGRVRDKQFPVLFRGSRYAERLPIGEKATLEHFPRAALLRFYRDWYRPELMTVIAVGDFDPSRIEAMVRATLGQVPARAGGRARTLFPVPDHDSTYIALTTDPELTSSEVSVYYKQPARTIRTVGEYRRSLVEQLYGDMLNYRLDEMRQKPDAPFVGAYSGQGSFVRTKEVYLLGAMVKPGGITRGLDAVLREAKRVAQHGFTAAELARAKANVLRGWEQMYAEREKSESAQFAERYAWHVLQGGPIPGVATEYRLVEGLLPGIRLEETNALAREWITDRSRVILASAPAADSTTVPSVAQLRETMIGAWQADVAAYADTVSDAPLVSVPPAQGRIVSSVRDSVLGTTTWRLSNGVRVILKPTDFKADEVQFTAYGPGGTTNAPDSLALAADFSAEAVNVGGAGPYDAITLRKKLAGKVAGATPWVAPTQEGIDGSASPKDLETMFQLVWLYATQPRRDSSAFLAAKQGMRAMLANRDRSPETPFYDTLRVVMAQHHPRVRPLTAARVDSVRLDDAMRFYEERFADMDDFTFVIVGSFTPDSIRPLVEQWLATLPATPRTDSWRDLGIRPPTGQVARTVRKGIEPKARTLLAFTGPFEFTPANRVAMNALAEVLTITLRERLREALGGTYGVSVSGSPSRIPVPSYSFYISFSSAPGQVEPLVQAVRAEIDSLRLRGARVADLQKVQETMLRERETGLRENSWWLRRLAAYDQYGEDLRGVLAGDRYARALTPETIGEAARRWLSGENVVRLTLLPEK
ncbi:MAG: M16 family metallopeptidase [Gemmatimonadaceae bacterium]